MLTLQHSVPIADLGNFQESFRLSAIKELGRKKLSMKEVILLQKFFHSEENSIIKREIISTIGRQRKEQNLDVLIEFSHERDPKLALQALRGMSYFKSNTKVCSRIMELKKHKNELVREFIQHIIPSNHSNKPSKQKISTNKIIHGDVLESLRGVDDGAVHLTFTSPPYYNARDYSIYTSYEEYLDFLERVFVQLHRVTAEGRFFVFNTSPVLIPRTSRQTSSRRYAIPFDTHARIQKIGFEFIDDIIWKKPDPSAKNRNGGFFQHRKPLAYKPNLVAEYLMVYRKKTDKLLDWNMRQYDNDVVEQSKVGGVYEHTNVWEIGPSSNKIHPAIFPKKLAENVIKYYSYVGDLVLDPFAGIGTVGMACMDNNRKYLLIEREDRYVDVMKKNLE